MIKRIIAIVNYLKTIQPIKKNIFPQNVQNSCKSMRISKAKLLTYFVHMLLIFKLLKDDIQKIFSLAARGNYFYNLPLTINKKCQQKKKPQRR